MFIPQNNSVVQYVIHEFYVAWGETAIKCHTQAQKLVC